jgi:hypothetical protein
MLRSFRRDGWQLEVKHNGDAKTNAPFVFPVMTTGVGVAAITTHTLSGSLGHAERLRTVEPTTGPRIVPA